MVFGRDDLLAMLAGEVGAIEAASAVSLLVGEPGIGKSEVVRAVAEAADAAGHRVLAIRPAQAEVGATWGGLADLLASVPDDVLDRLPSPQRRALDAACLRIEPPEAGIDPRAVWTALRSVLVDLAADAPVLVLVDDLHWLDVASDGALAYAARRLPATGVGLLGALRPPGPDGTSEMLAVPGARTHQVGPLDEDAVGRIVRRHLGVALTRPDLARIHAAAAGNPMFAVELARADAYRAGRPSAVPPSLQDLVGRRVRALSPDGRRSLAAIAAAGRPTLAQLASTGLDAGLAEAEAAALARVEGPVVVPSHPLVGASAYAGCSVPERRDVHARLAVVASGAEDRARHAALGAEEADAAALGDLDAAATAAARRGAVDAAADLATLSLDLTPADAPERWQRLLAAGGHRFRSGDSATAHRHLEEVLVGDGPVAVRAVAASRMTELAWETEPAEVAVGFARRAVALAEGDDVLLAEAEVMLSRTLGVVDLVESTEAAARALALLDAEHAPDPGLLTGALVASAGARLESGLGLDRDLFARAVALEAEAPNPRIADRASAGLASLLKYADDLDGCRDQLAAMRVAVEVEGDESSLPFVLGHIVQLELWAGRWDVADEAAREHLLLAQRVGQDGQRRQAEYNLATVAAHRGEEDAAREIAAQLSAEGRANGDAWSEMSAENVLGFTAFARDDHEAAVAHYEVGYALAERMGLREPGRTRHRADHVESLVVRGERERARALLAEYEARARALDRRSALGVAARARALLAASDGDDAAAVAAVEEALELLGTAPDGVFAFEHARAQLVAGRLHRRARRKAAARDALTAARDAFAGLGAARFAAQAEHELTRIGLRPAAPDDLTATERRIAELAASGLSTKQVADAAFLSPKTVEANLTRIYRKLGLRSRAELGAWFAREQEPGQR